MIKRRPARRTPLASRPIPKTQFFKTKFRRLGHETLERRELLAAEVLAIRPDSAGLLRDGDTLNVAPRELNVYFNGGANLAESSINSNTVRLVRSGGDGVFGNGNDVTVALGYVGLVTPNDTSPTNLQQIVIRPASSASHNATDPAFAFPDDFYQIQIVGSGSSPLADRTGQAFGGGVDFITNFRLDRGAQVLSVIPQPITRNASGSLVQASNQIVVHFDQQTLNRSDAEDPSFFRLIDTRATGAAGNERTLLPQQSQYDAIANTVTLTFAADIPEGTYRLEVGLSRAGNNSLAAAVRVGTLFNNNTFNHNGFIGDSPGRSDDSLDRDFYRHELVSGSTLNVTHQSHHPALQTRARLLDAGGNPLVDNTTGNFSFVVPQSGTYYLELSSANGGIGSYRVQSSVTGNAVSTSDQNSTFTTATQLGSLGAAGIALNAQIQPQSIPLPPYPGGQDEPGHRQIQREAHIGAAGTDPSLPSPTVVRRYYFPLTLGTDTSGNTYLNLITEEEKRIVRAIFDIFANLSGYQFIESTATVHGGDQLMIGKGDLRALDPSLGPGSGVAGLGGGSAVVLNGSLFAQANRFFGDGFTGTMFHEIGHALGLGHSYELPSTMGAGLPNDVQPGDHDVVHLQRLVPPNSTDIDMYRFEVTQRGRLSAETFAQRLATPSLLNSVLKLYREVPGGGHELVASNDRYFGNDSFIELDLDPGVYFIGVSSTGNDNYDPNVPDSGFGGTTNGTYRLELRFDADRGGLLRDADGTPIDGNADGTPGGVHQFWFQAGSAETTIYVDRVNDPLLGGSGGNGSIQNPFDRISTALAQSASRIVVPLGGPAEIASGDSFVVDDGSAPVTLTFGPSGQINHTTASSPEALAQQIAAAINASSSSATATASGRVVRLSNIERIDLDGVPALRNAPNVVRIVGNGGTDGNLNTPVNNFPYLIGIDPLGNSLRDGAEFKVPQGVTVMLEAGALIKMRAANIDAGTSSVNLSRAGGAIQVLGMPGLPVWLRSFHDDAFGGDSDGPSVGPRPGDFGGIVIRGDSDLEPRGIFLNHVTHADIRHGGGRVFVDSDEAVFTPVHIVDARPTVRFNRISAGADAAVSANPNSFNDADGRLGPEIVGNFLQSNSIDGLFVRIRTELGNVLDRLDGPGRFANSDITHVLSENLIISGSPGGPLRNHITGQTVARASGRLMIDPGVVVKLSGSRIEAERGASTLIAEGTENRPVIFTSIADDRYGGSGSFDTNRDGFSTGAAGHWGGLYFGHVSSGSIDHALIAFGGGDSPIEGGSANFNVIEVHQATLRVTNSEIRNNASGAAGGVRSGRGTNQAAVIYARGSQPVVIGNTFVGNAGAVLNINANSLTHRILPDPGRATGSIDAFAQFADNHGPLVRLNRLLGNATNGILVRGEELTTESVWDDTDIVHVLTSEIRIDNHHTYSGLRLQSSNSESLVVKLAGASAGFTASGTPLDIIDRIGGTVQVLGTPGFPVVLTHLADDSVGAGFAPNGTVMTNTNNSAAPTTGSIGGWRGLLFDQWSNDRNVAIIREREAPLTAGRDINRTPATAQPLGVLAPNEKSGDENSRLGFEIHGFISPDDPGDVDVYSFRGTAGTPIWIDIDRTDPALDAIVEVINAAGTVLARSVRSGDPNFSGNLNSLPLTQNPLLGGDFYTQNFRDPGLHYVLPGTTGTAGTYFIRVRSNPQATPISQLAGKSSGKYQLQIRLQQVDEFPGSTVQFADIRFAQTGIDVQGLPKRSPLIGEAGEIEPNNTFDQAQPLTNLLQTDMAAISISGALSGATDVDWYEFDLRHVGVQVIGGVNDAPGTVAVVFDLDYADQAVRADTTIAVFDSAQRLIFVGRESNIADDQPVGAGTSVDDLSRGSLGKKDPYIGPVHLIPGNTYRVAVMSNQQLPTALMGAYLANPNPEISDPATNKPNALVRLEPINSVRRVVEDHIGFSGYNSHAFPVTPETQRIFDISAAGIANHVVPFSLKDVVLYVATDNAGSPDNDHLYTVNPYSSERYLTRVTPDSGLVSGINDVQDIVIRSDGRMFGYQRIDAGTNTVGALVEINPSTGQTTLVGNDNIPSGTPNTRNLNTNLGSHSQRAEQFTVSSEVDAFTFQRRGTTGPTSAPVPIYNTYYVARETDVAVSPAITGFPVGSNSKLYRGRENGDATPAIASGSNPRYGLMGDIQPAGVTFASRIISVQNNANPAQSTDIRLESKLPGDIGNTINIAISRPNNTNATVSVSGTTITLNIGGTGSPINAAPTAAAIVNAINSHAVASRLVTAVIVGGSDSGNGTDGTVAIGVSGGGPLTGGANGPNGPLVGRVTGISYGNFLGNGNLYGVTNAGEFLVIDPDSGTVLQRIDTTNSLGIANLDFQGLTLGPQNVNGGQFANTLFAVTGDGRIVAFDTSGNGVFAFDSGNASQLITVAPGVPSTDGFFTLTFDNGTTRQTTQPIHATAPSTVTVNERQAFSTSAYSGSFTLSLVNDQGATTSPTANISDTATSFNVQSLAGFPAAPFVIRVQDEEMLVTNRIGTTLTVDRGINGTTASAHPDTATVYEVVTSALATNLPSPVSSTVAANIDNQPTSTTLTVSNAAAFPAAPFTIRVDSEEMLVTAVTGNDLTVARAQNGTTIAHHNSSRVVRVVSDTVTVVNGTPFPTSGFNIRINNEDLRVTSRSGNVLNVIRGANGTTATAHSSSATVFRLDTTPTLQFNATAAQVRTALGGLPSVGGISNVQVSGALDGTANAAVTVEFVGALAGKNLRPLTADLTRLVGDEIQRLSLDSSATGGTFRLQFNGQITNPIAFNANAATVQAELEALSTIRPGNVVVTGTALPGGPLSIQFVGTLQDQNVAAIIGQPAGLTFNEKQRVVTTGLPTAGTFRLNINDAGNGIVGSSDPINFNDTAAAVQAAIVAGIPALNGNIVVTGGPLPGDAIVIEFTGAYANTDVAQFTVTNSMTGGSASVTTLSPVILTTLREGQPVSVPVNTLSNGVVSVRDALVALPTINAADIRVSGDLQGGGITVNFQGQYAGRDLAPLEANNFAMRNGSNAGVAVIGTPTDSSTDSFVLSATGMTSGAVRAIGLAFSPLDFNLWHPTMKRGNDPGHGINPAPDATRAPSTVSQTIADPGPGPDRTTNQGAGGASLHFGFEQWVQSPTAGTLSYLTYAANTQYGIRTLAQHQDLSSNPNIVGTYNFPGGALGSLVSSGFSLAGSVADDRPTLYFNYFLDTQNHAGSSIESDVNDPFRDSARVYASRNGGLTWELLATNNSRLSGGNRSNGSQHAELPPFLSHLSDAGLNSSGQWPVNHQIVQELMDSTGQWRQARVDLSSFAGVPDVMLRFDFSTAGAMRDASLGATDANFGEFRHDTRSIRSLNNAFEGFYIDDIIVGFAERGEMVTGAVADSRVFNLGGNNRTHRGNDPNAFPVILNGPYQMEIRRTEAEFAAHRDGLNLITATYHTNDRHINTLAQTAFFNFESPAPTWTPTSVTFGGVTIPQIAIAPWATATDRSFSAPTSLRSGNVSTIQPVSIYQVTASQLGGSTAAGIIEFYYSVSSREDVNGLRFLIDGVPQVLDLAGDGHSHGTTAHDPLLASGDQQFRLASFSFPSGNSTFTWVYDFTDNSNPDGANRAWIDNIRLLQGGTGLAADRNRHRPQGAFIIDSNTITDSAVRGINVQPGSPQSPGMPNPGSTINFPELNQERFVPGVVIQNNIITGSSGIRYAGEANSTAQRPVPFGRIVNNTLVGVGGGNGILVEGLAAPTVMNNIIANFQTGIAGATGSTIVRSNYYQGNGATGPQGTDGLVRPAGTPLFVDAANGNYYLVPGSPAVDSSLNVLQDRFNYANFKNAIGIPQSPIFAPDRDAFGQLRVDSGQAPGGGGSSVFKDRGAVDRADFDSPFVVMLDPIDNDITGIDLDPNLTVVALPDPIVEYFSFLLTDGRGPASPFEGTGVDPLTVSRDVVTVRRNNVPLVEGVDYVLGFNESTGEMRLTPLATLWEPDGVYEITLDNQVIRDRAGNRLRNNRPDGTTRFTIILPDVEFDFGDAPNSYGTLLASNGARHALLPGAMPRLGRFVDSEEEGRPAPASDDAPNPVTVTSDTVSGIFVINPVAANHVQIRIDGVAPSAGDRLTIDVGSGPVTFELVPHDIAPAADNVAVRFDTSDTAETIAQKLASAISARLRSSGDALEVAIDPAQPDTITIDTFDDEDGVGIARLINSDLDPIVFVRPDGSHHSQYAETTTDNANVLGFLNPLEPAGAQIAVTVTGTGFLDAWIDFNGNGVFDASEKVLNSVAVVDGVNILTIHTPPGTTDKLTWARFRLSPEGGLQPTGLAVGGEVEDYRVQIINVPLPQPVIDNYTMLEDEALDTFEDGLAAVIENDTLSPLIFTPIEVIVVDGPQFAASFSLDPATGHFTYEPLTDFSGLDTFTYYIATQQSAADNMPPGTALGTVTIDVRPVNDPPLAQDQPFITLEDTPITITAEQLLAGAVAHFDPQYPVGAPGLPWDESNQTLRVISIQAGSTVVTAANANQGPFATAHGTITATFDADTGWLESLVYLPNLDLNRDHVTLLPYGSELVFDLFQFTIEDDGVLIDPITDDPIQSQPLTHTATATLDVAPQNDNPTTTNDVVTVGPIGAGTISPINSTTAWSQYFIGLGLPVPVPTEDQPLVIPSAFVLQNDLAGSPTATDENQFINDNDGPLTVISVSMVNPAQGSVSLDQDGNILFQPAANLYGEVRFTYVVQDQGVDEDVLGNRVVNPLTATGTVTINIQPVNDPPVAYDRSLRFGESANPGSSGPFTFTATQLLTGSAGETPAIPGPDAAGLATPFNETEQAIRVVAFSTLAGSADVASLPSGTGTLTLASDSGGTFEFDFVSGAFTQGRFRTAPDYNERTPFAPFELLRFTIEDDGRTTDPQTGQTVTLPTERSVTEATLEIRITEANDAPIFTMPSGFAFNENQGQSVVQTNFVTNVAPGPLTALDELQRQNVTFSFTPLNVPAGMMTALPTITVNGGPNNWPGTGTLNVFPAADAFGFAVYLVTATDNDPINPRSTSQMLTITINPVNDVPVAFNRSLNVTEAVERDSETALLTFDANRLLVGIAPEQPSVEGAFPSSLSNLYNETEQTLRVVAFGVPGQPNVDVAVNEPGLTGGTGTVTRTTVTGGTLTFVFQAGAFVSGSYAPAIDYNERTPFNPSDLFTYVISDDGRTTLPGSGFVGFGGSSTDSTIFLPQERSAPATVTITVTQKNDPPIFTMPTGFTFNENNGQTVSQSGFVTTVAPGPLTALDELQRQNVTFSFTPVNVPTGMMTANPTITVNGGPGNWPGTGTLNVFPAADAFGFAVYQVTATDNDPVDPRTTSQLLTITINPINDVPVAFNRDLRVTEAVEVDGQTALLTFTAERLLQGVSPETPNVAGAFPTSLISPYNETEQTLRVVAFGVPGAANVDVNTLPGGSGTVTRTTVTGGTLTFVFQAGAFVSGTYAPAIDYNERTPFDPVDLFTYIISDDGRTTLPGSGFVNFGGSSSDSTIFLPQQRSAPATVRITVAQRNDPPIFTMPSGFTFDENTGQSVSQPGFVTTVAPGPLTALDELERQNVTFSFSPVNVPAGMMTALPTITVNGGPNNWPGSGTLNVFPAADAFGFAVYLVTATDDDPVNPRSTSQLLTITINPVNDAPVAFDRALSVVEAVEVDGEVALITFDANRLLAGIAPEQPSAAGNFPPALSNLYNETEQTLRVVAFGVVGQQDVDVANLPGGSGTVTRTTVTGGTLTFVFQSGAFVSGTYRPAIDYNERTPFDPVDLFTFVISDDGRTTLPGSGFVNFGGTNTDSTIFLTQERSAPATVTITVTPANDPPVFNFQPVVNILERDDNGETRISGWATGIAPGPATALDELARQSVSFSFVASQSTVPAGLFRQDPVVTPEGRLSVFPVRDAVGTAIVVMRATDFEPTAGFVPRSTDATFTINIQPVNDPPVHNPARFGTSDSLDADTAWAVNSAGTIIYTLREDNTQPGGDTSVDYFIPLRSLNVIDVYNQIGLLDVFLVGPPNEADNTPGGSQTLSLVDNFPRTTQLGGTLTLTTVDGRAGLLYRPPVDANLVNRGIDSFTYTVIDNGQTYVLGGNPFVDGTLVDNPLTATGRVELRLNPVNDRPEFVLTTDYVEAAEDTTLVTMNAFATNIAAGPPTATDERSGATAQTVSFTLTPLNFTRGGANDPFGAGFPQISPTGRLTFQPLPDVFGIFEFEVVLVDSGPGLDTNRGDLNRSLPVTLTIQIQPINDPPVLVGDPVPLEYEVLEDSFIDIPVDGLAGLPGLLDNFRVGPDNEAEDIAPLPGGNQTLSLQTPLPSVTTQNGTLTPIFDDQGNLTHLRYTPRLHFAGIDTFGFTVIDDGETVDVGTGGVARPDPRTATAGVTINVLPVNDAPIFSGGGNVSSQEDQGLVTIENWATGIQAGPTGADDELIGELPGLPSIDPQTVEFIITQISSQGSTVFSPLFTTMPFATITGSTATLTYETAPDANGVAVFEVVLRDSGPNDPTRGDVNTSQRRTFTITVGAVNDPPQFTPGGNVTVDEDSGPYSAPWATNILPGPPTAIDELATQTVSFDVSFVIVTPTGLTNMFTAGGAPAIDANGVLTFTTASNAAGEVLVEVVAVDSEGGRSEAVFFTIFVTNVNDPPTAGNITLQGDEDNVLTIRPDDLLAVAQDPDLLTNPDEELRVIDMATVSAAGAVIRINAAGEFEYDPRGSEILQALAPGEFFLDTFTYRVVDAAGAVSNLATVTVNVAGINDAPTTNPVFVFAAPGQATTIAPLENDFDIDGTIDPTTIFITQQPANGTLVVRPDGTLIYTPRPSFRGTDIVRYTVADNLGQQSEQATITIDVSDPPVARDDVAGTYVEDPIVIDLAQNDTATTSALDLESIEIITQPSQGTVTVIGGGRVSYQANDGFVGTDTFTYRIRDIDGRRSNIGTVTVQVVGSELQNPLRTPDVNNDGTVAPLDALLILNRLSLGQRQGFPGSIPVEEIADELPRRFYDVDGNGRVEPLDALLVLNHIARANRPGGNAEAESIAAAPPILAASFAEDQLAIAPAFTYAEELSEEVDFEVKLADYAFDNDDSYDLLAADVTETRERRDDSLELELVDAVWGEL